MVTVPLDIDVLLFALFAPILGVLGLWFLQLLLIEIQKWMLGRLRHKHESFCKFTNFIGILFQTISHALGYTVTHSGIASFHVTVHYGDVSPKRIKTGVFEWIAHSFLLFGPFFIPAGLVLLFGSAVIGKGFSYPTPVQYTFLETITNFGASVSVFAQELLSFLCRIDLFNPLHVGFLLALVFFGLGIRPSYIGEERKTKIDMIHDLRNIKDHLIQKPGYLVAIVLCVYALYFIILFLHTNWFMSVFTVFGWIALTAIIALVLTYLLLLLIRATDAIGGRWKAVPYLTIPISYAVARFLFVYIPFRYIETGSLLIMMLSTVTVTILLIKYKETNRFKTKTKMKHMTVEDGKKRASKK